MAWGIFMTFITLFGIMVLAIHEATTTGTASRSSTDSTWSRVAGKRHTTCGRPRKDAVSIPQSPFKS